MLYRVLLHFFSLILCLGLAGNVIASGYEVGLYFDTVTKQSCVEGGLYTPMEAFLVLHGVSADETVAGWECKVSYEGQGSLGLLNLNGGALNAGAGEDYVVGLSHGLHGGADVVLASFSVFALGEMSVFLSAVDDPSVPGFLNGAFVLRGQEGTFQEMIPASGQGEASLRVGVTSCDTISYSPQSGPTSISLGSILEQQREPDHHVVIEHGECQDCLGYVSGGDDYLPIGLADFQLDEEGDLYLADNVNGRILVLDSQLEYKATVVCKEKIEEFEESQISVCVRTRSGELHFVDKQSLRLVPYDCSALSMEGGDTFSLTDFVRSSGQIQLLGSVDGNKNTTTEWLVSPTLPRYGGALLRHHLVDNKMFLRVDYKGSSSAVFRATPVVYVLDVTGALTKSVDVSFLLDEIGTYRPPHSTRCGPDGTIVMVAVTPEYTKVWRWNND